MITINLPGRPLSVNHIWRSTSRGGKPITYKTAEGKDATEAWKLIARTQFRSQNQGSIQCFEGDLEVTVKFYFDNKARRDIDNFLKVALDTLTGVVWLDDSQIWKLHVEKHIASIDEGTRTIIEINKI